MHEEYQFTGTKRVGQDSSIIAYDDLLFIPPSVTHILASIPPRADGDMVYERFAKQIKAHGKIKWLGYLSSTTVYGDHDGNWVDETSKLLPSSAVAKQRILAEKQWLALGAETNIPVNIFRLSGIYGPNRSVFERIAEPSYQIIHKAGQYFSRIHVEDIARIIKTSITDETTGGIFNLSDDLPCNPELPAYYAYELLGQTPPKAVKYEEAKLSLMMKLFYQDNKRVKNDKIKSHLKVTLLHPTYKEGLTSIYNQLS
jgi:nucleoside-diphosphate-sugar epimerase